MAVTFDSVVNPTHSTTCSFLKKQRTTTTKKQKPKQKNKKPKCIRRKLRVQLCWQTSPEYGGLSWSVVDISIITPLMEIDFLAS